MYSQQWDHRAKCVNASVAHAVCYSGPRLRLEDLPTRAWAGSVTIHHLLPSAFCNCERWRDLWSEWFSSWFFLCEYRCGNPLQVGEWKCQCVTIWTYICGSTFSNAMNCGAISLPPQPFSILQPICFLGIFPYGNDGQEQIERRLLKQLCTREKATCLFIFSDSRIQSKTQILLMN